MKLIVLAVMLATVLAPILILDSLTQPVPPKGA